MKKKYCESELIKYSKKDIITLFMTLQKNTEVLSQAVAEQKAQLAQANQNLELILGQLKISKQNRFGRSCEKNIIEDQLVMCFNEAEVTIVDKYVVEPEVEQVCPKPYKRKKVKGKRDKDLKGVPVVVINHELSDDDLKNLFDGKYRRLPDEVYKRLAFHPVQFEVEEHHVAVYAGNNDKIVHAEHPVDLLRNSIATPSLEAAIINS